MNSLVHHPQARSGRFRPQPLRVVGLRALALCALFLSLASGLSFAQPPLEEGVARLHYQRPDGDYQGWELHVWEDTVESVTWASGLPVTGQSPHGVYWDVRLSEGAQRLGFIVHRGDLKDPGPDMFLNVAQHGLEVWLVSGSDHIHSSPPLAPPDDGVARLHYHRPDSDYDGWELHVWEHTSESVTWERGLSPTGATDYGPYWDVRLADEATRLGFIVHRGDDKDPGPDMFLAIEGASAEAWLVSGSSTIHTQRPDLVGGAGGGDLRSFRAHWVRRDLILWPLGTPLPDLVFRLHHADTGGLQIASADDGGGISGGAALGLSLDPDGPPAEVLARFPHLAGSLALRLPQDAMAWLRTLLRGQVAVSVQDAQGRVLDASGLQIAGVLDDLFANDAPLGLHWQDGVPTISVWAPTARRVDLLLMPQEADGPDHPSVQRRRMTRQHETGVWRLTGQADWRGLDYLFEVEVYVPSSGRVEVNLVTDPYSVSLRMNSARSQVVDLDDPALKPPGWDELVKAPFSDPVDAVVYELHLRDFSAADASVPEDLRGGYLAFTLPDSDGVRHLRNLAEAGLSHLHLLPTFDLATIDEDRGNWREPELPDLPLPSSSPAFQAAVGAGRDADGFNWGYDPWHYLVPEGSYASDPDGSARVLEFRQMVMALHDMGLRVVLDVVFNHTNAAGQAQRSVLDRIVPGYYHRLDAAGNVAMSSCCPGTATEHAMMERLMLDAVALWARAYKVDGFRFDLMGHHMAINMQHVRQVLDVLTPEQDGVHGASMLLYGEGWDFGEVAQNARGVNATQFNMAGSGIGTFSDRLRDAVRGGSPFDSGNDLVARQGFASGLGTLLNEAMPAAPAAAFAQQAREAADLVRLGLAGNLAHVRFQTADGSVRSGFELDYNGQPAGYALVPQDQVVYVSKHDNQTLWDILQLKLPLELGTHDRVRLQLLALSTVAYAQGMPFFHAGDDLLRSKSLDRNSYDSGDWFNAIDWSGQTTNMGRGLPLEGDNRESWNVIRPRLTNPLSNPGPDDMAFAAAAFQEMLRVRASSPLFRLRTAEDIVARLTFHHTGPDVFPGVIVMELRDDLPGLPDLDPAHERLLLVVNASPWRANVVVPGAEGMGWRVHPVLRDGVDAEALRSASVYSDGRATVPAFSSVVFVVPQLR